MLYPPELQIHERHEMRNRTGVYSDRREAGLLLAEMMVDLRGIDGLVLAIPAGGIPVAAGLASSLDLPLDVTVVSKITLPWNTEAGYGAVAFDGTVRINRELASAVGLSDDDIEAGVAGTTGKVERRMKTLRGEKPFPVLEGKTAVLVDDGLASGFTMFVAIEAVRRVGTERVIVAVPTAPEDTLIKVAERVDAVYCPNIREGRPYAVADAYQRWYDVGEEEAATYLEEV